MTAETAVVLPVLVLLAAVLAWLVAAGVCQVRVVDAARETARALARGESTQVSQSYGEQVAPPGSRFRIRQGGGEIQVEVSAKITGPRGWLTFPGFVARSTAIARSEP